MYYLSCNNGWYNGMKFSSLAEAVEKQRKATAAGEICDVMRHEDNNTTKVVKCDAVAHASRLNR